MDRLYNRLPAVYRMRDAEQGQPLRALLGVMEEELLRVEQDIGDLYDGFFIETCAEWLVPYIGDLVAATPLHSLAGAGVSLRAYVANTLAYRRRKGTAAVLEAICRDSTGWPARVVELFQLLATTQYLNHQRPENVRTLSFRQTSQLELIDSPFDTAPHTADVRPFTRRRGRHNIPNIAVYAWRLQSYLVERSSARNVASPADGRFTFDPFGLSNPLFTNPQPMNELAHLVQEQDVPDTLRRRVLYDELEALRQGQVDNTASNPVYFGTTPCLRVYEGAKEIPPAQILIARLPDVAVPTGWRRPPATLPYTPSDGVSPVRKLPIRVAVDPVLGRLAFGAGVAPAGPVRVSFNYGFPADCGGGPYDRTDSIADALARGVTWQAVVGEGLISFNGEPVFNTMGAAVAAWNAVAPGNVGLIAVADSRSYVENLTAVSAISVPHGSLLIVIAANWPDVPNPAVPGGRHRVVGGIAPAEVRPCLRGAVSITGVAGGAGEPGQLIWNGLLVEGNFSIAAGDLGSLQITHATLKRGLTVSANPNLTVELHSGISGRVALDSSVPTFLADSSIVLAGVAVPPAVTSIDAPGAVCTINGSTVFGTVRAQQLSASDSILAGAASAERVQAGCIRFCYVAPGSKTPRRHRCQPDLAVAARQRELGVTTLAAAEQARVLLLAAPLFAARDFGSPYLAQLSPGCPNGISAGADDGSEMGVYGALKQPQRRANFAAASDGFVPVGMNAGLVERT
jgi:hypothetical protein